MILNPRISVIVIAYQRKKFIRVALESLFRQSFPKDRYEIIVVKNFIDNEIDSFIQSHSVKNIYSNAPDLGDKCIEGIQNSNGEIIVFLEDDDFFAVDKLEVIDKVFEDANIVYFHNCHQLVDLNGSISKFNLFSKFNKDLTLTKSNLNHKTLGFALKIGFSFNLSSIAIRRSMLHNQLIPLKGMNVAIDNYMFYLSLTSGKSLISSPLKLTFYRVHGDNSSLPLEDNANVLLLKAHKFLKSDLYGYKVIENTIKDQLIKNLIECRIIGPKLNLHIIDSTSEMITMQDYVKALKCGLRMRNKDPIILAIVDLLSIRYKLLGRRLYVLYLKNKTYGK